MALEIEAKYRVAEPQRLRQRLHALGFRVIGRRRLEHNWLFDAPRGHVLRLRQSGPEWILTAKGPRRAGALKRREEIEITVADGGACRALLELAGHRMTMEYRRHRTVFARTGERGEVAWDETPIGLYVEIEGGAGWVRRTARELGFGAADVEVRSYPELYCSSAEGP